VDEGLPIAYTVLEDDVAVYDATGAHVATVHHVIAAPHQDVFHGIVVRTENGLRFVAADQVAAIHERGVDLRLDADGVAALPKPSGEAPSYHDVEPGVAPHAWRTWLDRLTGADPHRRDWRRDD
jgi:hypothetical protein